MPKSKVFISHITEEAALAKNLKEFIEGRFLRAVDVFASSHERSIQLGDEWFNAVKSSVTSCELMVAICSPVSVGRPWINFECGAGWARGLPVVPMCHSGLVPGQLPAPLNSLQAGMLNATHSVQQLFDRIAEIAQIDAPSAEDEQFFSAVTAFESDVTANLLLKDSKFVSNLLGYHTSILAYCIFASTRDYNWFNSAHASISELAQHDFSFNDTRYLFNTALLLSAPGRKVYEVLHITVKHIIDEVRFVLSNGHLLLAPSLEVLLHEFLYASSLTDRWYSAVQMFDRNSSQEDDLRTMAKGMIEREPLPPTRKPSNSINAFIDYYESLLFYRDWILQYSALISQLTGIRTT